ncbi:hypothetical protein H5410_041241 [Solanum commersonii]|uniref:Retrotransposon gag domain-containing protein n=1 Tax=Solanum commersonii TaxID=4109 RepID=A0A9J5XT34_SOLCO|nr:hypothetical protein H5410_041241 [Solanum commersonii]
MEKSKLDVQRQKMHDLEKKMNGGLNSKPAHDLRYEKLCLHPRVELPSGFKILKSTCSMDSDKWLAWEDMTRDFVEQYKFNTKIDPTLSGLFKVRKLSHESFEEYVIRWRMKASKIRLLPNEEELNTEQVHAIFDSSDMRFKHYNPKVSQLKNCAYHSNIQGHDIEEFQALRNKIQNMIENGKIIVQQGPLNNNCNPASMYAVIVQEDPTKIYSRPFTRMHKSHQRN